MSDTTAMERWMYRGIIRKTVREHRKLYRAFERAVEMLYEDATINAIVAFLLSQGIEPFTYGLHRTIFGRAFCEDNIDGKPCQKCKDALAAEWTGIYEGTFAVLIDLANSYEIFDGEDLLASSNN